MDELTEEQMEEIQEELNEHIRELSPHQAELMALHLGFSTAHVIAIGEGKNEAWFREHILGALEAYLQGNPFQGNASTRTQ